MAVPTTRQQFADYVLRKLGYPVIEVEVTGEQVDDRIDEGLKRYWQYHHDGTQRVYLDHVVDASTIANKYVTVGPEITGVVAIFDVGFPGYTSGDILLNIPFQIFASDLQNIMSLSSSVSNYVLLRVQLNTMAEFLLGKQLIRFNQHVNRVYLDVDEAKLKVGQHLVIEAWSRVSPEEYPDVWGDVWLGRYVTELTRLQWAVNLGKYANIKLPGGVVMNSGEMQNLALSKIQALEEELWNSSTPPLIFYA